MRGESKSGFSTYYIKLCCSRNVFDAMLDRIGEMNLNVSSSIDVIDFRTTLKKEWQNHYELLTSEYG